MPKVPENGMRRLHMYRSTTVLDTEGGEGHSAAMEG